MRNAPKSGELGIIHLEKVVKATPACCFGCFASTAALRRWYDPEASLNRLRVGGKLSADYFPGYTIIALIRNQLIVQRFSTVIDGIGIWSFVSKAKTTRVVFDHIAAGNRGREFHARTFHWQGLLENLAAVCEHRRSPFVDGQYQGRLPRGIRYATCGTYVEGMKRRPE